MSQSKVLVLRGVRRNKRDRELEDLLKEDILSLDERDRDWLMEPLSVNEPIIEEMGAMVEDAGDEAPGNHHFCFEIMMKFLMIMICCCSSQECPLP
jgi:hypothetical protein